MVLIRLPDPSKSSITTRDENVIPIYWIRIYRSAMRSHDWIDARSLALDARIAEKLEAVPSLLDHVRATLRRWIAQREPDVPVALREWDDILNRTSTDAIVALLRRDDPHIRRLRQSSPFCGILTPAERLAILKDHETRRT